MNLTTQDKRCIVVIDLSPISVLSNLVINAQAIEEALTPRLNLTGEMTTLTKFKKFFEGKSLEKGTNILLLWRSAGVLDVVAKANSDTQDFSQACV